MFNKKQLFAFTAFALATNFVTAEVTQAPKENFFSKNKTLLIGAGACATTAIATIIATYLIKDYEDQKKIEYMKTKLSNELAGLEDELNLDEDELKLAEENRILAHNVYEEKLEQLIKEKAALKETIANFEIGGIFTDPKTEKAVKEVFLLLEGKKNIKELTDEEISKEKELFEKLKNKKTNKAPLKLISIDTLARINAFFKDTPKDKEEAALIEGVKKLIPSSIYHKFESLQEKRAEQKTSAAVETVTSTKPTEDINKK